MRGSACNSESCRVTPRTHGHLKIQAWMMNSGMEFPHTNLKSDSNCCLRCCCHIFCKDHFEKLISALAKQKLTYTPTSLRENVTLQPLQPSETVAEQAFEIFRHLIKRTSSSTKENMQLKSSTEKSLSKNYVLLSKHIKYWMHSHYSEECVYQTYYMIVWLILFA